MSKTISKRNKRIVSDYLDELPPGRTVTIKGLVEQYHKEFNAPTSAEIRHILAMHPHMIHYENDNGEWVKQ